GMEFSPRTGRFGSGAKGTVSIRFERIRLGPDAGARDTRGRAVVKETIFSGSSVLYVAVLAGSSVELTVEAPYDGTSAPIATGSEVDIGWDGGATTLFDND
ncbi:TOBE domain-containing protein, partial [Rhizobiaceae sp. 2RAB30]